MATYRIADIIVEMNSSGRTHKQAEPYRIADEKAQLVIISDADRLHEENPHLSMDDCEYLSTGSCFYRRLAFFDGILLHSSCVVVDGKAYLFSAPCGTGKSTHVELWLKLFGDRAFILNDDKPAIRMVDGKLYIYGTPWSGKHDLSVNTRAELGGIAFVKRAKENSISRMNPVNAMFHLLDQTTRAFSDKTYSSAMKVLDSIIATGQVFELRCNMDISAARLSYETMSGKRFVEHED